MTNPSLPIQTIDAKDVAKILNCSPKTVLEKAGLGELRGAKIGKSWVFKLSDVHQYFNDQIEKQTIARQNRYKPPTPSSDKRSFETPTFTKKRYPDLTPYRNLNLHNT